MTSSGAKQSSAEQRWRFPRGAGALSPALMDEIQQARLFEAMCAALAQEGGYAKTTVAKIIERAGMSTKTFYDYFDNKEACLLAAYRTYGAQLGADLAAAWSGPQRWAEKVVAAIAALLGFGAEQPDQLRFLLLDASSVAPALLAAQREALEPLSARLREGRAAGERAPDLVPGTEEMIVAALAQRVGRCLLDGDRLADLQGEMVEFALTPYMGWEGAREVATGASSSPATLDVSPQPSRVEGHSPASLDDRQRRRAFDSLPALLAEHSYGALTVNHILQRIGMSSRTFYALFESKDGCLLTAYRFLAGQLEVKLDAAWQTEQSWPAKVRAAIATALAFAAEEPAAARLLAVEVQAAGRVARAAQAESIDRLAAKLREGRRLYPAAAGLNRSTETVIVAGLVSLIGNRLLAGQAERLPDCESELVGLALAPFVGAERARGLARP